MTITEFTSFIQYRAITKNYLIPFLNRIEADSELNNYLRVGTL